MKHVNEGTTSYLTISCKDKDGVLAAPSAVSYSVYCLTTKQEVRAVTVLAPAAQIEITLTPADTAILATGNKSERKRVTVVASYGAGDGVNDDYDFTVDNLSGVA
jgi:hypothetical protein